MTRSGKAQRAAALVVLAVCGCLHLVLGASLQSAGADGTPAPALAGNPPTAVATEHERGCEQERAPHETPERGTVDAARECLVPRWAKAPVGMPPATEVAATGESIAPRRATGLVHAAGRRAAGNVSALLQVFRC
ncbi:MULTISPECIES: hypothetical protein [Actinomadura]|uniref:Secreted protein n=1 Tax=Actinomadura yumaensis TaxID=111807 RepID=A0ABW2CZJ3_9ACTN|nr:hypothetical protein [Actinomadura sp. J1-007]MWK38890.1 hypothetical protein [Actinomadura sp. J1-007]